MEHEAALLRYVLRLWRAFWNVVDHGGVMCQLLFYPAMVISGISMAWNGKAPSIVETRMGEVVGTVWLYTVLIAPIVCAFGVYVSKHKNKYIGVGLECSANTTVSIMVWAYVASLTHLVWNNVASFAVWMALALGLLTALIACRDARRLLGFEHRARQNQDT